MSDWSQTGFVEEANGSDKRGWLLRMRCIISMRESGIASLICVTIGVTGRVGPVATLCRADGIAVRVDLVGTLCRTAVEAAGRVGLGATLCRAAGGVARTGRGETIGWRVAARVVGA